MGQADPTHAVILAEIRSVGVQLRANTARLDRMDDRQDRFESKVDVHLTNQDRRLGSLEAVANRGRGALSASLKIGGALTVAAGLLLALARWIWPSLPSSGG